MPDDPDNGGEHDSRRAALIGLVVIAVLVIVGYYLMTALRQNASLEENGYVGLDDLKRIQSFTAPDAKTIVVVLKETLARDVAIGVANSIGPVPKHVWQGKPWNDPAANPEILRPTVDAGPYVLKDLKEAESASFVPNPNWFKGAPNFSSPNM